MLRISRFIGKCLLFIFILPCAAISSNISVDNMPREFSGEFLWRKQNAVIYAVTLKISVIEEANDGNLIFKGLHIYQPGNYLMKVKGTIDPKTAHISIFEMDPSREDSVTDGSFEGKIAEDMSSITAVWTTKTTGEKGDISLKAIREEFAKTEEIEENDPVALLDQGIAFGNEGQHDRAIAYFNKALELNPRFAEAYKYRGLAYNYKGQHDKAISDYTKAIEINPRFAKAYNNRGIVYYSRGQHDKAILDFYEAIEINPRHFKAYWNRGIIHAEKGQHDKAISDYDKALEINPRFAKAYHNRGIAYAMGKAQFDKAISDYDKAIEINPRFAKAYNNRGIAYFEKREYEKAWDDVNKAQDLGAQVHPGFLKALREASGRQK